MFKNRILYFPEEDKGGAASEQTPVEMSLDEKLEKLSTKVSSENTASVQLANLVSDPDIRAVLEAKQQGKKIRVSREDESSESLVPKDDTVSDEDVDLDELSRVDLARYISKKTVQTLVPLLDNKFKTVDDNLKPLQASIRASQNSEVRKKIEAVKEKYSDFETFRPIMAEINSQIGGTIEPEELYILAKNRAGKLFQNTGSQSERPDSFGAIESKPATGKYRGHGGLQRLLDEGINKAFE